MSLAAAVAPVASALRSGFEESIHHGVGIAVDPDGRATAGVGDPAVVIYPRSSLKPLQATAMIELGLDLPPDLLALACASHDGAPRHLDGVRRLLDAFGLDESDLQNTPSRPYDAEARAAARVAGVPPSSLQQNCSGKHAAMLATCRLNGWTIDDYLDPDHPLQRHIIARIGELAGTVHHIGVDGCGAPTVALALRDLAGALSTVVSRRWPVALAMSAEPEMVGGPGRDVTIAMRAAPGLVVKDGAQGVAAGALPSGAAFALKIADGSDLARRVVTLEALARIGVELPAGDVARITVPVLGHGAPVGEVRALEWASCSS